MGYLVIKRKFQYKCTCDIYDKMLTVIFLEDILDCFQREDIDTIK